MNISIIGLGYIGLPTAAFISSKGYKVFGFDTNDNLITNLNNGNFDFPEKRLNDLLSGELKSGRLMLSNSLKKSDVYIICVPTPITFDSQGSPKTDITYVMDAAKSILDLGISENDLVILESTSPIGTTRNIQKLFNSNNMFPRLAYCPERVIPGNLLNELKNNDRIVGGIDDSSSELASKFYADIITGEVHTTDCKTAELCKLTENSFRDANLAFANQISMICDKHDINPYRLIELANKHPRVNILSPGPGVGGHCIAVDPWFILDTNPDANFIREARITNLNKTQFVIQLVQSISIELSKNLKRKANVCFFGMTYKPDIDDIRESPACEIINNTADFFKEVTIFDPYVHTPWNFKIVNDFPLDNNFDVIIFLVKHSQFYELIRKGHLDGIIKSDYCGILHDLSVQKSTYS